MDLNTRYFGELTIREEEIINFQKGIPAFEDVKRFVIISDSDPTSPFKWLQCVDDGNLIFAIANPFMIKKDYDFEIDDKALAEINVTKIEDVEIYSMLVIPEDISKMTINLKAPLIINHKERLGNQVILDTDKYSVRHYIIEDLKSCWEVNVDAGAFKEEGAVNCCK